MCSAPAIDFSTGVLMHDVRRRWYHYHMKLNLGTIQRRGHKFYLALRSENKSKWVSLKTSSLSIAKKRARKLFPPEDSERAWLMHLAELGSNATAELRKRDVMAKLTCQNLWDEFLSKSVGTLTSTSEISCERWMRIISDTVDALGLTLDEHHQERILRPDNRQVARRIRLGKAYSRLLPSRMAHPGPWPSRM